MTTPEPTSHNLAPLLEPSGKIAIIWCVEDVLSLRPDLSNEQAWTVLKHCRDAHDSQLGINWDVLACWAELLFPTRSSDGCEQLPQSQQASPHQSPPTATPMTTLPATIPQANEGSESLDPNAGRQGYWGPYRQDHALPDKGEDLFPEGSGIAVATPGPYAVGRQADGVDEFWTIVSTTTGKCLASILFWGDDPLWRSQTHADAVFLAASSAMHAALQNMLAALANVSGLPAAYYAAEQEALAALAAAESGGLG